MKQFLFLILAPLFISACAQPGHKPLSANSVNDPSSPGDTLWTQKVVKPNTEWKKILTAEQFNITREQGTEIPFTSEFYDNHEKGIYYCICCSNPLFSSVHKFNSGTGWPSYWKPYSSKSVNKNSDTSLGMSRDEISCMRCGAHLGHVFDDGPPPTGLRYCIDGVALKFKKSEE